MKEYWVNVYDQSFKPLYEFSGKSTTREASVRLADINYTYGTERLLYRVHVKMKDKIGLSRNYYWTFDEWKFFSGSQWTPEQMKETKPKYEPTFIGMKLSDGSWI